MCAGCVEDFEAGLLSSSMFESLFPPPKRMRPFDSAGAGDAPNDDLPSRWNPASLVTAAQSQQHGKTDERRLYKNKMRRASSAYGNAQKKVKGKQDEMPHNFNLQSIRKPRRRSQKSKRKDIFWGSESIVTSVEADHESPGSTQQNRGSDSGFGMDDDEDDYNFFPVNDASNHYLMNQQLVEKRRRKRDRQRLGIILFVAVMIFSVCLGLFLSRRRNDGNERSPRPPPTSTYPKIDDGIPRNEAPLRPIPPSPVEPTDWNEGSGLHTITIDKLHFIVHQITPDASILSDPITPQSKALAWAKEDMKIYNVEVESRVAQRYALATLYYATNGTGWTTDLKWGNGHE